MQSVTEIYNYLKKYDYCTAVMGASFRNIGEIQQLAGCDLLTISPKLLGELDMTTAELPRRLSPAQAKESEIARIEIDKVTFEQMHCGNQMASEQLTKGIAGFTTALVGLEKLLANRLSEIGENSHPSIATH